MSQLGAQETRSDGLSFFVQDQFTYSRFTFNVGLRAEQWKHFASTGENIFTFDWAVAPRLSAAFDVRGDGRQKIYGYYGRYYDPIRNNMRVANCLLSLTRPASGATTTRSPSRSAK